MADAETEEEKKSNQEQAEVPDDKGKKSVKIDSEKPTPEVLQGSPTAKLRAENERRSTLAKVREKELSKFEAKRASRLSRSIAGPSAPGPPLAPAKTSLKKSADITDKVPQNLSIVGDREVAEPRASVRISVGPRASQIPLASRVSRGPSIMSSRRMSMGEDRQKIPKFAPTYRMESKNPFKASEVYPILRDVVEYECERKKPYDPNYAGKRSLEIAKDIRSAIRALGYDRYKLCVKVDFGQNLDQGVCSIARFMWDLEKDDFAYASCDNIYFYVIVSVYALYYD